MDACDCRLDERPTDDGECPVHSRDGQPTLLDDAPIDHTRAPGDAGEHICVRLETGPRADAEFRRGATDARTLAQVRADLFCELMLTGVPASCDGDMFAHIAAQIQVTVPALTLAGGETGGPALLAGHGPIDQAFARRLAGLAPGWDRVFSDPYSGEVLAVDRYRPSAQIKRYLAARDERCRAPGCTRPVHRCDCDHTVAAVDGGPTCAENLGHVCRRHHTGKHHTAWRVRQLGHGVIEWIGPTGRRYADRPPRHACSRYTRGCAAGTRSPGNRQLRRGLSITARTGLRYGWISTGVPAGSWASRSVATPSR